MPTGPPTYASVSLISHLAIDWLPDGACVHVLVFGEVDLCGTPRLAEQIRRAAEMGDEVVVDLKGVTFMDCAGLGTLLEARTNMGPERFSVTAGPPQVQRLFELAGTTGLLRVTRRPLTLGRRAA